jgi:hypothetical protein
MFLSPYTDLTPSYPNVHNKFGVRYYLNLVLVDEEDRRYFKQQVGGVCGRVCREKGVWAVGRGQG